MGIPAFYRWLVTKYPLSVVDVLEEVPAIVNGVKVPVDTSQPNPNCIEFDNLYLDMNGIIHPCFHPDGQTAPKTYEEVFKAVFKYIDRIFAMIRPRKLLYMAIDGVAPRAKMNQQRARRFRAAKDAADAAMAEERLRSVFKSEGEKLAVLEQTKMLDSNVITPGTQFMATLSSALQYYIHLRMNSDPGWRGIKVILSDANVPGEGEHKIMSYIRLQRNLPGFDPNTRHCLYGLDADLIMLALTTHEIHFSILREDVRKAQANDKKRNFGKNSRVNQQEKNKELKLGEVEGEDNIDYILKQQFQFLNIWVLRDYLMHDLRIPDPAVTADLERLIDDFVLMCVFVGNDFLPHMPSLEISEGAIDLLMTVYKKEFVRMGGYLTDSSEVNLERVQHFIQVVGSHENAIFRKRTQVQKEREKIFERLSNRKRGNGKQKQNSGKLWYSDLIPTPICSTSQSSCAKESQSLINNTRPDDAIAVVDNIKLGEEGWKERFYAEKFEANTEDEREKIRRRAVLKYIEGICWVMCYYYQGVCSWQWFYPYHYAPFASDFYHLDRLEIHFTLGEPFKPFDQLMGVLPAASAHALPLFYRKLMTDSSSPILDFYPDDFELDMNGKRFAWQAICKLPFIKESRLLAEITKVEDTLTDEEKQRNSLGLDALFIHVSHPLAAKIFSFCKRKKDHPKLPKAKVKRKINPKFSDGMNGYIYISDKPVWPLEFHSPIDDMEIITNSKVISVFYKYPLIHPHVPRPPEGVVIPRMSVRKQDILPPQPLWHEESAVRGRVFFERPVPKSISGSSLSQMSHRLVSQHYLVPKKKTGGPAELDGRITRNVSSHQPNSQAMIHVKKMGDGKGIQMNGTKLGKRKQGDRSIEGQKLKTAEPAEVNGHISKVMVHEKKMENGEGIHVNGTKLGKRKQDSPSIKNKKLKTAGPSVTNGHITRDISCQLNSKEIVHEKKMGV